MPEAKCPNCSGSMVPRKSKSGDWFFVCVKYPSCRGTRSIYFDRPDPFYAVANSGAMIAASLDRLLDWLKSQEDEADGNSVSHVKRIDRCLADYWKGKAR